MLQKEEECKSDGGGLLLPGGTPIAFGGSSAVGSFEQGSGDLVGKHLNNVVCSPLDVDGLDFAPRPFSADRDPFIPARLTPFRRESA